MIPLPFIQSLRDLKFNLDIESPQLTTLRDFLWIGRNM